MYCTLRRLDFGLILSYYKFNLNLKYHAYCLVSVQCNHMYFLPQIKLFEKQECVEERRRIARDIYDNFIMKELLAHSHVSISTTTYFFTLFLLTEN